MSHYLIDVQHHPTDRVGWGMVPAHAADSDDSAKSVLKTEKSIGQQYGTIDAIATRAATFKFTHAEGL
jgi:hypothetical protein